MKYTYNMGNNKVVCVSHYAGKPVRGIAKCNEEYDKFNAETGMKLAKLRCDEKIALKRINNTTRKVNKAIEEMIEAQDVVEKLTNLLESSMQEYAQIKADRANMEDQLSKVQNKILYNQ